MPRITAASLCAALAIACAACSSPSSSPSHRTPTPSPSTSASPSPSDTPTPTPTATPTPTPTATPTPTPTASPATCQADAQHCCQPDGSIVGATCAPVIRKESDSRSRGPDGMCAPCMLRCLPASALIRTPSGDRRIDSLRAGDPVWTASATGAPRIDRIVQVNANPVLAPHQLLVLALADGRTLQVSAGHPALDGSPLGALRPGQLLDGAAIVTITQQPYTGAATWDLLPAGPTGAYWADDVLIGSTLAPRAP